MPVAQKMNPKIGLNLRVTGNCNQGDRKYMEDVFTVAYQQSADGSDLEYAFFGMFDGHGGKEAAVFAKENLLDNIVALPEFWSSNDEDVLKAIKDGFITTHKAMFKELDNWPRTASGLPSTSGTTASVAFIRQAKLYIGHVGDSGIVLGEHVSDRNVWKATPLTQDHKPESAMEIARIQQCGGKVLWKAGVPRVVWNRPRIGHKGPVRRSTPIDEIPFLAVARSLGDLWSYNSAQDAFVVSPEPDVHVIDLDVTKHRCLIFGTDGLWNVITPAQAVWSVQEADTFNERHLLNSPPEVAENSDKAPWINPSKQLVDHALEAWFSRGLRADNCSVVTVLLDPPGPPRSYVLWMQKQQKLQAEAVRHLPLQPDFMQAGTSSQAEDCIPNLKKLEILTKETIGNQEYPSALTIQNETKTSVSPTTSLTPHLSAALGFGPPVPPISVDSSTGSLSETDKNTHQLRERNKHEKEGEIAKKSTPPEARLSAKRSPSGVTRLLEVKRPRTRSCSRDRTTESDRNASDAENEQSPSLRKRARTKSASILSQSLRNSVSRVALKEPKMSKKTSSDIATVFQGRILRSSHTPIASLVRSLRSHTQGNSSTPSVTTTPKSKKCEKSKTRTQSWHAQHNRRRSRYSKVK